MVENSNKRIAKNTMYLYVRMIFVLAISLYTSRIVLNVLGVMDYGVYNVVCGFVVMFNFLNTSMSNAIQRFYNYERGKSGLESLNIIYNNAIIIQFIIAAIIVVVVEVFGVWYVNNVMVIPIERLHAANWIFQFSIVSMVLIISNVPYSAAIMAHERMGYFAVVSVVDVLLKLIVVILLPHLPGDKLIIYGLLALTISLITFLMNYLYTHFQFRNLRFQFCYKVSILKEMFSFSCWNVLDTLAHTLKNQGTNILLNYFFGPIVNAASGIAMQVSGALQSFAYNIFTAFRPQLVQSYAEDNYARVRNMMYIMTKFSYSIMFFLALPIIIEVNYVLHIWLGDNISTYTASFVVLVIMNMIVANLNTPISQVVQATGRLKTYQLTATAIIGLTIPVAYICLKLGMIAEIVYVVILCITIINQTVSLFLMQKVFNYSIKDYLMKALLPCSIITISAPILPLIICKSMETSFVRLIVVIISDVIVAVPLFYFVLLNSEERVIVNKFIKSKIKR